MVMRQINETDCVSLGERPGALFPGAQYLGADSPNVLELIDLDRDGNLDAIVSERFGARLVVFAGNARGEFRPTYSVALDGNAVDLARIDTNRDGIADLAVAIASPDQVVVFVGDGKGGLRQDEVLPCPVAPSALGIGHVFDRGSRDIVVVGDFGFGTGAILVAYEDDKLGGFLAPRTHALSLGAADHVVLGDLDGDLLVEVAVADTFGRAVSVLRRAPGGPLEVSLSLPLGSKPESLVIGDIDQDGQAELVVGGRNELNVFRDDGAGGYAGEQILTGNICSWIFIRDVTGDHVPDLVTLFNLGTIGVLKGLGGGRFGDESLFAIGSIVGESALRDVNKDGVADFVMSSTISDSVMVTLGDEDPLFHTKVGLAGGEIGPFAVLDLDADGILDLVASEPFINETLFLYRGLGGDQYELIETHPLANSVEDLIVLDVVGSSHPDVLVCDSGPDQLWVFEGHGNGTFTLFAIYDYLGPIAHIGNGDLDGDGTDEVLLARLFSSLVVVNAATGDSVHYALPGQASIRPQAKDFDGDGHIDVISVDGNDVVLLRGDGSGGLSSPVILFNPGTIVEGIASGDFDRDGDQDLVVTAFDELLTVLEGQGDGSFTVRETHMVGPGAESIRIADVDADGTLDILANVHDAYALRLFLGNGDGSFRFERSYASSNFPGPPVAVDRDGDGAVDLFIEPLAIMAGIPQRRP